MKEITPYSSLPLRISTFSPLQKQKAEEQTAGKAQATIFLVKNNSYSTVTQNHLAGHGQRVSTPEETDMTLAPCKPSLPAFYSCPRENHLAGKVNSKLGVYYISITIVKIHFVSTKQGHFLCKNYIYHIYQNAQEGQTPKNHNYNHIT